MDDNPPEDRIRDLERRMTNIETAVYTYLGEIAKGSRIVRKSLERENDG
jgi:hypothetical protein